MHIQKTQHSTVSDTITEPSGLPVFVLCTDMKTKVQEIKFLLSAEVRICT